MPLPLGHAAIGITAAELFRDESPLRQNWKLYLWAAFLSNLPDFDMIAGLLFHGNGSIFHRGATHSLLFALVAGFLASLASRRWSKLPQISFIGSFLLIFSHVAADMLLTDGDISLFWPFEVYLSNDHSTWAEILNRIIFETVKDASIILGCGLIFLLNRLRRLAVDKSGPPEVISESILD
jgi:membrane-bound metal-dependent hydrolase YbcI (DUF457 family)